MELDEFPIPKRAPEAWPSDKAKEHAFYTASLAHADPNSPFKNPNASDEENVADMENTYDVTKSSLEQDGHSSNMDELSKYYNTKEDVHTQQILSDYIADPSIPNEAKKIVLSNYNITKQLPTSLKQIYLRKAAVEDHAVTEADRNSQDMILESFQERASKQNQVALEEQKFRESLNEGGTELTAIGSVAGDLAKNMLIPGASAGSFIYGVQDAFPGVSRTKGFFLPGSMKKEIGKIYDAASPEQKLEILRTVLPHIKNIPGTDYTQFEIFQSIVANHDMATWEVALENISGLFDVSILGKAVKSPIDFLKASFAALTPDLTSKGFFGLRSADAVIKAGKTAEETLNTTQQKIVYTYTPKPSPASIMSVVGKVNPAKGSKARMEALLDDSGKVADAMGTSRGEILGEQLPQWTKAIDDINPDLAEKLRANDRYFSNTLAENTLDPNFVEVTKRGIDREKIYRTFKEAKGAHYQQANSTMIDDLTSIHGTAVFGRNAENGFSTRTAALQKMEDLKAVLPPEDITNISVRTVGGASYNTTEPIKLYRGAKGQESTVGNAFFYSPNKDVANTYAGTSGKVTEQTIQFKNLVEGNTWSDVKTKLGLKQSDSMETLVKTAREQGYDGVSFTTTNGKEYIHIPDAKLKAQGQHYVHVDYSRNYNPFDEFMMGSQTVNAKIYPIPFSDIAINMDGFAKTFLGRHIFPSTTMMDTWIPKGASSASMRSTKVESDFVRVIKDDILSVKQREELGKELRLVQENQKWKSYRDLAASNSHLSKAEVDSLYSGYVNFRRLTDYQYEWANLADYKIRHAQGQKAIYTNTGDHLGYGSRVGETEASQVKYAWDMDEGKAVKIEFDKAGKPVLNGKEIVRLDNPMNKTLDEVDDIQGGFQRLADDNIFEFGLVGGKTKLHELPQRTLNRIEGYVPRKNIENYYIKKIPKQVRVNGELISDPNKLAKYAKTIGAEWSEARAISLRDKFAEEFPNYTIKHVEDRLNSTDSIITDHKVHQEIAEHSRRRGERVPTLDKGVPARLEDPLETMVDSIRNSVRLGIWSDYIDVFRKNYTKAFREFLDEGQFPNVITDLKSPAVKSKENIAKFKAAQVLFKQFTNQQYKVTLGDDVWKSVFHGIGDILEKTNIRGVSEASRDIARQGNLLTKVPKSITSALFLHLNPARQWVVQTQQQIEWAALMPKNAIGRMQATGAVGMAILSKASYMKGVDNSVYKLAQKASGLEAKEFDAVVEAIHKSGIPQSVDLNMMLHGIVNDAKLSLNASVGKQVTEVPMNVIRTPASLGKAIGYTPAELSNTIGTWLFARDRWLRDNPGKNWNTPENIAKISGDAWDLAGSMSTRAGAMPYQDGFVSMFFQFAAIQQKMLMQLFSGKTLNKTERGKLIAAKMVLWGAYGTAFNAVLDKMVAGINDVDFQANWNKYKGGIMDAITNKLVDTLFKESGEPPSQLAVSGSMSPLPTSHPYIQVVEELIKAIDNDPNSSPRFAFIGAMGGVYKAAIDIKDVLTAMPIDSPETWEMAAREALESASGWNNYQKAMLIKEIGDKKDKFGNNMNLQLGEEEMIAQLFGVVTRDELMGYKMTNAKFEESNYVKDRAKEINDFMKTHEAKYGTPDWDEGLRRIRSLNAFTPEHLRETVEDEVLKLQRRIGKSSGENTIQYILNNIRSNHAGKMTEMLGYLKSMDTPEANRAIKELQDSGLIEGE